METLPLRLVAYTLLAALAAGIAGYGLLGLRADTQQVEVERELGRLGGELRSLAAAGEGSRRTLELRLPDGVEWVALGVDPDPDGDGTPSNNSLGAPGELLYRLQGGGTHRLPWGLCLPLQTAGGAPVLRGGGTRRLQAEIGMDVLTGERSLHISGADLGLPAPAMGGGKTLRLQRFAQGGATADINISGNGGRVEVELPRGARVQRATLEARGDPAESARGWDLVFLLDGSTSMIPLDPQGERRRITLQFIETAGPYHRVAAVEFHREARVLSPLRPLGSPEEKARLREAILNNSTLVPETRISTGLREARRILDESPPSARRGIFLLSDGMSQFGGSLPRESEDNLALQEAREIGRQGVKLFTVQLETPECRGCHTEKVPPGEPHPERGWGGYLLRQMAQAAGGESYYAAEASAIETVFRSFTQFLLHYPESPRVSIAGQEDPRWRPQALPRGAPLPDLSGPLNQALQECRGDPCRIPLQFRAQGQGSLNLSHLDIQYTLPGGACQ